MTSGENISRRSEISSPIQVRRIRYNNWANDLKVKSERLLICVERAYSEYRSFIMEHPFIGLFASIFIVFSAIPLLSFISFSLMTTIITLGTVVFTGLFIWASLIGGAGFILSVALILIFFITCIIFFWISIALLTTSFIAKKLNDANNPSNGSNNNMNHFMDNIVDNIMGIDLSKFNFATITNIFDTKNNNNNNNSDSDSNNNDNNSNNNLEEEGGKENQKYHYQKQNNQQQKQQNYYKHSFTNGGGF